MDGLRERKRADSRARVVDVAFGLFAERGYDEVTVAEVCTAAGIAPRTFFRYFPTKDDVLTEPARVLADRVQAELAATPAGVSDTAALHAALLVVGAELVADDQRAAGLFRVLRQAPAARAHPLMRLGDRERVVAAALVDRTGGTVDWRVRLTVARSTAAFRVWLDDLVDGAVEGDPMAHLREVLDAS